MDTTLHMLDVLARRYSFDDVAVLVSDGACHGRRTPEQINEIRQLCDFGGRLIELDAEDFGSPRATPDVPADLVLRAEQSRMPRAPRERDRGALGSLRPAFSLLLEVIAIRWSRHELSAMVAALHIAGEYLPLLAWEPMLKHAGDPLLMPASVGGRGSLWGAIDDRRCPQSMAQKSAAERSLRVATEPPAGWRAYLDRQHSLVSEGLAVCAADCKTACSVISRYGGEQREHLARACRVAEEFEGSALIRLRHSAPVGHGFGVPSTAEVLRAWTHTQDVLAHKAPSVRVDDGYPLPGLTSLFSDLAGAPIRPDTLVRDTMTRLREDLSEGV